MFRSVLACFLLGWLAACSSPTRPVAQDDHRLILVSIDGFRADFIERGHTPNLLSLARRGVRAVALHPSFPTLTFPNHYTLVTGLYPDHHGIVNNRMVDPGSGRRFVYKEQATIEDARWWGGEPLWVGAERHGIRSATMYWPGSTVAIGGVRPQAWKLFDASVGADRRVAQLLEWLDAPPPQRPRLLTLYFDQVDHEGHRYGPDSPELDRTLADVDAALGRLVAGLGERGLLDSTDLVVVSDHGQAPTSPALRTYLDDEIRLADVEVVNYGILAGIEPHAGRTAVVEAALLRPHANMQCWRKGEVPARLHFGTHPRIPSLLCLAVPGGIVTQHAYADDGGTYSLGEHGYDPADPHMDALFVAAGPHFREGVVAPALDNVDVYPLLAHVLGIPAAPNDGDVAHARDLLRTDAR